MSHEELMRLALEEAGQAAREGEVPWARCWPGRVR